MLKRLPIKTYRFWGSAVLALALGLAGCGQSSETPETQTETNSAASSAEKPTVVASYSVLCDLTEEIAQDTVDLNCLIDPGQDPHTYSASPSDRQAVEQAELILYGGYEFEPGVIGLVEATNTPVPKVAVNEEAVSNPLMGHHDHNEGEEHAHDHEEEEQASGEAGETVAEGEGELEPDPHVWHNVQNVIAMVEVIRTQLAEVNPDEADFYASNAEQLKSELEQLDAWVKEQIATIPEGQRTLITTHDALGYYVQAYGFETSEALQGISAEEAPTASRVKELVEVIDRAKVPTIFAEVTANDRVIGTVAREANVKVSEQKLLVDGLGEEGSETGTYIGTISNNTCAIVDGLGGQCTPFSEQAARQ